MKMPSDRIWLAVLVISAIVACMSGITAILSLEDGRMTEAALSIASLIIFIICMILARMIMLRMKHLNRMGDEVRCLRLKRPGIERPQIDEIIPKGKMPKE